MKKLYSTVVIVAVAVVFCTATSFAQVTRYVVTDDDNFSNSATFYTIGAGGALTQSTVVPTGGAGLGGGYFSTPRVNVVRANGCIYVANNADSPGTIAGIVESTQTLVGTFAGSAGDNGDGLGIGLAVGTGHLYAGFTGSGTIGTFRLLSGCKLQFMRDTPASGLGGGAIDGMKAHFGAILVVAYADGSIESFNLASGRPVSNGDKQYSTGYNLGYGVPAGVDISQDGHWAIFGDATGSGTALEVSDISAGSLSPTVAYLFSSGVNSNNVLLSPDQTL